MERMEIIRRLINISNHAVHVPGEAPLCLSIDDGIALDEAAELLMNTEKLEEALRNLAAFNENLQAQINSIVKCGDCRHYSAPMLGESAGQCLIKAGYFPVTEDWFCADGVRIEKTNRSDIPNSSQEGR